MSAAACELHVERLRLTHAIPRHVLHATTLTRLEDALTDDLILTLTKSLVAGDTIEEMHSAAYPADWWQHFKQRWYPASWIRRWPVAMKSLELPAKVIRMCPHVDIPNSERHFRWLAYGRNG